MGFNSSLVLHVSIADGPWRTVKLQRFYFILSTLVSGNKAFIQRKLLTTHFNRDSCSDYCGARMGGNYFVPFW